MHFFTLFCFVLFFCPSSNSPKSIRAALHGSSHLTNKTTENSRKFQSASQSKMWMKRLAVPLCNTLQVPKYSHFLAISTETGYLFLLTASTLYIKPQVPPRVSCPGRNLRHGAGPLASTPVNSSAHKQTPDIPLSVLPRLCDSDLEVQLESVRPHRHANKSTSDSRFVLCKVCEICV